MFSCFNKNLKKPKKYSETLIRRAYITIVKRKGTQRQTTIDIPLHWKLNIEHVKPPIKNCGKLICFRKMSSSCSTSGTRRVTLVISLWQVVYEERAWLWLWQTEDIRGHLWHRHSEMVNQIIHILIILWYKHHSLTLILEIFQLFSWIYLMVGILYLSRDGPQWPQSTDMHTLRRYMHLWSHLHCPHTIKCIFL